MGHLCERHNIFDGNIKGCPTCHELALCEKNCFAKTNGIVVGEIIKQNKEIADLKQHLTAAEKREEGLRVKINEAIASLPTYPACAKECLQKALKEKPPDDTEEKLKEFARHVIREQCWSIIDLDGGDVQEWAEKLGLIVPHAATSDDVDDEFDDYEVGDTIFKFSDVLKEKP